MVVIDVEELSRFLEEYDEIRAKCSKLNETQTRSSIINPFLSVLGWSRPWELKEGVRIKKWDRSIGEADYAFMIESRLLLLLEAKPLGGGLSPQDYGQIAMYCRAADVRWGALSDGDVFVLLDAQSKEKDAQEAVVLRFAIANAGNVAHYLEALSRHGIEAGLLDSLISHLQEKKAAIKRFQNNRTKLAETLRETFRPYLLDEGELQPLIDSFLANVQQFMERGGAQRKGDIQAQSRSLIPIPDSAVVSIFPANPDGVNFLERHKAWGWVRLGKTPEWAALYVTRPDCRIAYVGKVKRVVDAEEWRNQHSDELRTEDLQRYKPTKKVLEFDPANLYQLKDPIHRANGERGIQGQKRTTGRILMEAESLNDLGSVDDDM